MIRWVYTLGLSWVLTCAHLSHAQPTPHAAHSPTKSSKASPHLIEASPTWTELSPKQQTALNPLKKLWPEINQAQKRKWLAISRNYHDLPEQEQLTLHARMRDWVRMDPRERSQARLEYARAQTLSVDERRARWEAYLALSEEERKALAQHKSRRPKGAAIALRPAPTRQIPPVPPVAHQAQTPYAKGFSALRIDTDQIHPLTLLPLNVPGHASP